MLLAPPAFFIMEATDDPALPIIRFKDHNVELDPVLFRYRAGQTLDELAAWYDSLSRAELAAAIAFYHDQQLALDAWLDKIDALLRQQRLMTPKSAPQQRIERYLQRRLA